MQTQDLILRCYAKRQAELWSVVCVDLCLAAQAETLEAAKLKLEEQIKEYVFDAMAGEDKEHCADLMARKAPLSLLANYYMIKASTHLRSAKNGLSCLFDEILPMAPA